MIEKEDQEKRRLEAEMREATRKIEHYGEENSELNKAMDELKKENKKLTLYINLNLSKFSFASFPAANPQTSIILIG